MTGASGRQQMLYKKRAYEEKPVDSTQQAVPNKVTFLLFISHSQHSRYACFQVGKHQGRGYSVNQVTPKGGSEYY